MKKAHLNKKDGKWLLAFLGTFYPFSILLAVLLYVAALYFAGVPFDLMDNLSVMVFIVLCSMFILGLNAWVDRDHDIKKGKTFVRANKDFYSVFLALLTLFVIAAASTAFATRSSWYIFLSLTALIAGTAYSSLRKYPMLSMLTVALVSVYPVVLAFLASGETALWYFAVGVFLFVVGRETLTDTSDIWADSGYKKTLPVMYGEHAGYSISAAAYLLASVLLFYAFTGKVAHILAVLPIFFAGIFSLCEVEIRFLKGLADLGAIAVLIVTIFF